MSRVADAYRDVPAVSVTGVLGSFQFRGVLILRNGVIVGDQYGYGSETLVWKGVGPTYAREHGAPCWHHLTFSSRASSTRFPGIVNMHLGAPRRAGDSWLLPVTYQGHSGTFRIDATTLLLVTRPSTFGPHDLTVVEHDRALTKAPKLVTPEPQCYAPL